MNYIFIFITSILLHNSITLDKDDYIKQNYFIDYSTKFYKPEIDGKPLKKLDSLIIDDNSFNVVMDTIISLYINRDSLWLKNDNSILFINFFNRKNNNYFLVGANYFYTNKNLKDCLGYFFYRNKLVLISDKMGLLSAKIFYKSNQYKYFKYQHEKSYEESLKIEDDNLPGFLFKLIGSKFVFVQ